MSTKKINEAIEFLKERVEVDRRIRSVDTPGGQGSQDYDKFCEQGCEAVETLIQAVQDNEQELKIINSKVINITPQNVCCKKMVAKIGKTAAGDYILENILFQGGCKGNLTAISKLIQGKYLTEIIEMLEGNQCGNKGTSCMDQLTKALKVYVQRRGEIDETIEQ